MSNEHVFTWYDGGSTIELTYGALSCRAKAAATQILTASRPGDRVALLAPPGLDYILGFFGCLYAGVVPVPAYPPQGLRRREALQRILDDSGASLALTAAPSNDATPIGAAEGARTVRTLSTDFLRADLAGASAEWQRPPISAASLAFLQYTSGSTGTPKGVMVSHANLLTNCAVIHERFGHSRSTRGLLWLPPYHDMGLVGGIAQPIFSGTEIVLMAPLSIVQRPLGWLEAISRFGATVSGGPNFAYELCVRRIPPEARTELDLRSWKVAFIGAEPVRPETITRFTEAFAPYGFDPQAIYPCYGLAESTLFVTGGPAKDGLRMLPVGAAIPPRADNAEAVGETPTRTLVSCGQAAPDHEVVIVDPDRLTRCAEGGVGEIWLTGPSVAQGYWGRQALTEEVFGARLADGTGPYLRTGDLGLLLDRRLYVTGRRKDLIILHGSNHYPQDFEATVERSHQSVRAGGAVAFSITVDGEEKLVILVEVHPRAGAESEAIIAHVRRAIAEEHNVQPHSVVLVRPGAVPRTSSGKLRRFECRRAFLQGSLPVIATSVASESEPAVSADTPTRESFLALDGQARQSALENYLLVRIALRTGTRASDLDPGCDLIALGLDSLGIVGLQQECKNRWSLATSLSDLLNARTTVRSLAAQIAASLALEAPMWERSADGEARQEMTGSQRALWFLDRAYGGQAGLNLARAFTIRGALDPAALQRAFAQVVARHSWLHTCFPDHAGLPLAVDRGESLDWFCEVDAGEWDDSLVRRRLDDEVARPFDLARGPLFRVTLLVRGPGAWILLVQAHHIVMDFESLKVLVAELETIYNAEAHARVLPSGASAPPSFDLMERAPIESDALGRQRALDHWRAQIGTCVPVLHLPTDAPRVQHLSRRGGRIFFSIPAQIAAQLRSLARTERATPYVLLVTAWAVLLQRFTGQGEIVVGCPVSDRPSARLAQTVGYFVNLLPLRFAFGDDSLFTSLIARTQQQWAAALEHRGFAFWEIIEGLHLKRGSALQPVFQTLVSLNGSLAPAMSSAPAWTLGAGGDRFQLGDLALESIELPMGAAQVELALSLVTSADAMAGSIEYDAELFSAATADYIAARFLLLLEQVARMPETRTSRIPLLTPDERWQILVEQSAGISRKARYTSINDWWSAVARTHAERVALVFPEGSLTFSQLGAAVNGVAAQLIEKGLRPEEPVGIYAERLPETVAAMLGVLKAGGAFLPLDPAHPLARMERMLSDAGVRWVLARPTIRPELSKTVPFLPVDLLPARRAQVLNVDVSDRSAAYAIFTSGSTGAPKAVLVEHGGLCNLVESQIEAFGLTPESEVLQYASFGFDASVSEVFVTLLAGATLRLAAADDLLVGDNLGRALADGVTAVTLPPFVLSTLDPSAFRHLRTLVVAGEACSNAAIVRWSAGRRLINAYGPTEATVCATLGLCDTSTPGAVIGRPIPNVRTYVLDAAWEPVMPGAIGELFVGGCGVARCYLGRHDLTAERFVPDPFASDRGARMYRTGDLVRWRIDGSLHFVGRIDSQVKIRGVRVELGEVEAALAAHPAVAECAVVAKEAPHGEKQLVAYVAPAPGAAVPSSPELRAFLRALIPEQMVPATVVAVEALPRGTSGKIDRAALPDLPSVKESAPITFATELERLVSAVWCDVLAIEQIGLHENFFDAGGTSLSAAQVHARLQEQLGREFRLLDLFTYPTVRLLAGKLQHADEAAFSAAPMRAAADKARRTMMLIRQSKKENVDEEPGR